jgi:hypothetical protein
MNHPDRDYEALVGKFERLTPEDRKKMLREMLRLLMQSTLIHGNPDAPVMPEAARPALRIVRRA